MDHLVMSNRERVSHARGVYPIQGTTRMGTAKMKQEDEAVTIKITKEE